MSTEIAEKLEFNGSKIILPALPEKMKIEDAVKTLLRIQKEDETTINILELVDAFPLEGAYAMIQAMKDIYGWATPLPGGFFQRPPTTVSLEIGYRKSVQVIWGRFAVPNIEEGEFVSGTGEIDGRTCFAIHGSVKKKYMPDVKRLADRTREIVIERSIYRGQAIRLDVDDANDVNYERGPSFIDLAKVRETDMIFNTDLMSEITTNVFTPIEHTQACRDQEIPLKRGVLLESPYGTGKTLVAYVTAKKCVENGWTFIMLNRVGGLDQALQFARRYAPAVVFAEDVDRSISGEERTTEIDDALNTIDGLESKSHEIMCILTSNHADKISRAMLRPGRLDAVITLHPPDAEAAQRLIRLYARNRLPKSAEIAGAGAKLAGQIPAVIREVVERSKLYAISRGGDRTIENDDLEGAANQMLNHLRLLAGKPAEEHNVYERLGRSFADILGEHATEPGDGKKLIDKVTGAHMAASGASKSARAAKDMAEHATHAAGAALEVGKEIRQDVRDVKRSVAAKA